MSLLFRWLPFLVLLFIALADAAPLPELSMFERRDEDLLVVAERSLGELWEREFSDEYLMKRDILPLQVPIVRRNSVGNKIKEGFKKAGQGIKKAAQKVGQGVKTAAKKVGDGAKKATKKVGDGVKNAAKKVGNGVKTAAKKVGDGVKKAANGAKKVAQKAGNGIKKAAQKAGNGVKKAAQKVGEGVKTAAKKVGKGVKTAAQKTGKFVKENGAKVAKFGLQVYSTAQSVASKAMKFVPGVGKPISAAMDGASKVTGLAADKIKADMGSKLNKGYDVMNKIKNPISGAAGAALNALRREELEGLFGRYSDLEDRELFEEREVGEVDARNIEEDVLLAREDMDEIDARQLEVYDGFYARSLFHEDEASFERDFEADE